MINDDRIMGRALRLASLGRHASPNPMVGCVVVGCDGQIVGEGFHERPGLSHAEPVALRAAAEAAHGATAYVTLEPCSHHGRTPPCADALIEAGVARVVVAMQDPDVRVSGRGCQILREAGIEVDVGVCQDVARQLNRAYVKHRTTGLPWVTVKVATTLDGKIATQAGDSKWITSLVTRTWVHRQLRDRVDAIMVGVGTVLADDPSLTTRLRRGNARNPRRIVVDSHLRTPPTAALLGDNDGALIAHVAGASRLRSLELQAAGAELLEVAADEAGRVNLADLMVWLGARGDIVHILIEGGGTLIGSALRQGIVDRYVATIAPKLIGGGPAHGPTGIEPLASSMGDASIVRNSRFRRSGPDFIIDGEVERSPRNGGL